MLNLFEYQNKETISETFNGLEAFLDEIWSKREVNSFYIDSENENIESQRFLQFLHKTNQIKSTKYVGVIYFGTEKINLLPKIFYDKNKEVTDAEINQIHNHILWWLSYCRKIKLPNYQTALGETKSDFFEVLIYLFAKYTKELLCNSIYQQYEEITEETLYMKGRLNVTDYVKNNISNGHWHKPNCTYDAFVFDNEFNRIIKYVTNILFNATANQENKKYLREILFILDEVSNVRATAEQCSKIKFNQMLSSFDIVRDYCQLFLSNSISFDYKNDLKLFAFLLPMEYVFEDFIFGFIEREINDISIQAQRSDKYLDESKNFNMKPDLYIKTEKKSIIADTKYKIVYSDEENPSKKILQSDLYQMLAYAVRFKVNEVILFYPNSIFDTINTHIELLIKDSLANDQEIVIKAYQLPIVNVKQLQEPIDIKRNLNEVFESTKNILKENLKNILISNLSIATT